MSQPAVQTLQYALERTETTVPIPSSPDDTSQAVGDNVSEKPSKDVEAAEEPSAQVDIEQDDGVTRIEALCKLLVIS
jgi:hypothetical protein